MASSIFPTSQSGIFVPSLWQLPSGKFTREYADLHYLQFPLAQGTETIPNLNVTGITNLGATNISNSSLIITDGITTNTIDKTGYTTKNSVQNIAHYLNFSDNSATGIGPIQKSANFSVNPSTGTLTASGLVTATGGLTTGSGSVLTSAGTTTLTGATTATGLITANGGVTTGGSSVLTSAGTTTLTGATTATGLITANGGVTTGGSSVLTSAGTTTLTGATTATGLITANGGVTTGGSSVLTSAGTTTLTGATTATGLITANGGVSTTTVNYSYSALPTFTSTQIGYTVSSGGSIGFFGPSAAAFGTITIPTIGIWLVRLSSFFGFGTNTAQIILTATCSLPSITGLGVGQSSTLNSNGYSTSISTTFVFNNSNPNNVISCSINPCGVTNFGGTGNSYIHSILRIA